MSKRKWTGSAQDKAIAISYKNRRMYPYGEYGRGFFKRGTDENVYRFGATYKSANAAQREARKKFGYVGRGSYKKRLMSMAKAGGKYIARKYGAQIGGTLASGLIGPEAVTAGALIGRQVGRYIGRGSYVNSLIGSGVAPEVPHVAGFGDETGRIVVSRREYVKDIFGPESGDTFRLESFALNPGLENTFSWLSQIAQNYDEYELKQCIFTYRSTTTDIGSSSNGQCGTVIMATNYNPLANKFSSKNEMMEQSGAMSCKATESMSHGIECDPNKLSGSEGKYVRNRPVVNGQDIKSFDHGLFQLAVANSPVGFANEVIGELWVSYSVELRKPKFYSSAGLGISSALLVGDLNPTITTSDPFNASDLWLGSPTDVLTGQQNSIEIKMGKTESAQLSSRGDGDDYFIEFPEDFSGYLSVEFGLESDGNILIANNPIDIVLPQEFQTALDYGNIKWIADMYGLQETNVPADRAPTHKYNSIDRDGRAACCKVHIYIGATKVSGGERRPNRLYIVRDVALVNKRIMQWSIHVTEYNHGFSYKENGIGLSESPMLVDVTGRLTVPEA